MEPPILWHDLLGLICADFLADSPFAVEAETSSLLDLLLNRYREEGVTMAMTMQEFRRYYLRYNIEELTPEERLKGLPPEERLKGLSREVIENHLEGLKNEAPPATKKENEEPA
jgi:hypothetical protein